jgi:hypothetical protein
MLAHHRQWDIQPEELVTQLEWQAVKDILLDQPEW